MLIVGCQSCGEAKILAGTPDSDGVARVRWTCRHCGTGQVLQLEVTGDARNGDLRNILCGLALHQKDGDGAEDLSDEGEFAESQEGLPY